jgi:uncharacterized repeat protein (TIGR03843 family)
MSIGRSEEHNEDATQPRVAVRRILELLSTGTMQVIGLMPESSNYTFLAEIEADDLHGMAIYKPRRGERPLWDFPRGTLCQREVAASLMSEALGWRIVPPTVLRDGPEYGIGSVQLFIDADPQAHYFTIRGNDDTSLKRIATFDIVINNADRKGGHILQDRDGWLWGIDHGIAFHAEPKLRTVIWDYVGQPIPDNLIADIERVRRRLGTPDDSLTTALGQLLHSTEVEALRRRLDRLIRRPIFPEPSGNRSVPWPPI